AWQEIYHTGNFDPSIYLQGSNNLSDLSNTSTARANLGLGTAATANLTTNNLDNTSGRVLRVGDFGLGVGNGFQPTSDILESTPAGFYRSGSAQTGKPDS